MLRFFKEDYCFENVAKMMATSGKQLVRSKSGLRMVSVEEKDTSPFQLEEPPWIPDEQVRGIA